jgi:hypothetical protein
LWGGKERDTWEGYNQHLSLDTGKSHSGILNYQVRMRMLINRAEGRAARPFFVLPGRSRPGCQMGWRGRAMEAGPAQQPNQSDLMLPNFTLFRLWFSSFR